MDVVFDIRYKHEVLRQALREAIEKEQFGPGDRLPSESEMCRRYGVSNNTVREAVASLVSEGLVCRIHGKGTFIARRPASQSQRTVSVVVPEIYGEGAPLYARFSAHAGVLLDCIAGAAAADDLGCLLSISGGRADSERACLEKIIARGVDGAVVFYTGGSSNIDLLERLQKDGTPFVLIDRYVRDLDTNYVVSDNLNGAYQATRALLDAGYETVYGIFDAVECTSIEDRIAGFSKALGEAGVPAESYIKRWSKGNTVEDGALAAYDLAEQVRMADCSRLGFFASNASMAEGIWQVIRRDPECLDRVALAAFDWIPEEAEEIIPTLQVLQPLKDIAEGAVRILREAISGNPALRQVTLPVTLKSGMGL